MTIHNRVGLMVAAMVGALGVGASVHGATARAQTRRYTSEEARGRDRAEQSAPTHNTAEIIAHNKQVDALKSLKKRGKAARKAEKKVRNAQV